MALEKLEKVEEALALFKSRYDTVIEERDSLRNDVRELRESKDRLEKEKKEIRKKVNYLVKEFDKLGV